MASTSDSPARPRRGRAYVPAIGPRLRPWLWMVLGGFALLGANGAYLASISALGWWRGSTQHTFFYFMMFLLHLGLGLLLVVPFVAFGWVHLATSWNRPNRSAIRLGMALLAASMVLLTSGLLLVQLGGLYEVRDPRVRAVSYWLHVLTPIAAIALYVRHRLAGPRIRWDIARAWGGVVGLFIVVMATLHAQDFRRIGAKGPREGMAYFFPSEARTASGSFIPVKSMMMDDYCLKCHGDAYKGWQHSAHRFSSFNNPAYKFSVRETRKVSLARDGTTRAARWCAGCHDPAPFFGGEFDAEDYDDEKAPSSQAGITCTACHAITSVHNTRGNAAYTIEEPQHYPFAYSDNPALQFLNQMLVKAKPAMHKETFLKPLHRDPKFCATCHKVGLPHAVTDYKDFVRGQNHWDTFWLSGVSGHGARSFYYPPPDQKAKGSCNDCHMPYLASTDFGARDFDGKGGREIHDHFFPGANTAIGAFKDLPPEVSRRHEAYLKDKKVRVDLFALREGGTIDGRLLGPLRPETPTLTPGRRYLVEAVVRTLGVGHPLTQGTVDSNELWVELIASADGRVVGRSGGIDESGRVDPFAHFVNVYMLDRDGNRVDRRNPQDIFVPLYNKQIPPGAANVVHFGLDVPAGVRGPLSLEVRLNYRKFDQKYMDYVFGERLGPTLPVVSMARDVVHLPISGGPPARNEPSPIKDEWQRWNDYGIGLLLEGTDKGPQKGELLQAEPVFRRVAELGRADGWVNLARVHVRQGENARARDDLARARSHPSPPAPWVIEWLGAQLDENNGFLDEAIAKYEGVLATKIPDRGFDFGGDYEVINALGRTLYNRSRRERRGTAGRSALLARAIDAYRRTLAIDSENVAAHYGLGLAYRDLADATPADRWPGVATPEGLAKGVDAATDPGADDRPRAAAARDLAGMVAAFVSGPRPRSDSKMEPLHDLVDRLGPRLDPADHPESRGAQAGALAAAHKALHAMLKADETAEGRAVRIARERDPAADQNAQAVVIHPLHRPGAPGIDPPSPGSKPTATATAATATAADVAAYLRGDAR